MIYGGVDRAFATNRYRSGGDATPDRIDNGAVGMVYSPLLVLLLKEPNVRKRAEGAERYTLLLFQTTRQYVPPPLAHPITSCLSVGATKVRRTPRVDASSSCICATTLHDSAEIRERFAQERYYAGAL